MPDHDAQPPDFEWRLTSFEGARREQLRRWAQLPLERILLAIEEMQDVARLLGAAPAVECGESLRGSSVNEPLTASLPRGEDEGQGGRSDG